MRTDAYFSGKSSEYDKKRGSGILGKIVNKERDAVMEFLEVHANEVILDLGCGAGYYARLIKEKKAKVVGVDIAEKMVEDMKKQKIESYLGNIESFRLRKKFDKVLIAGALEFVDDAENVIQNSAFHLKKNGLLVILYPKSLPCGFLYKLYHLLHGIHINLFSRNKIKNLLEKNGFQQVEFNNAGINCDAVKCAKM